MSEAESGGDSAALVHGIVMRLFDEQALTVSKSGDTVKIQCDNADDSENVFEWLLRQEKIMSAESTPSAAPLDGIVIKPLKWSEHRVPNNDVPYDHRIAETPFGRFVLTWKSWKSEPWQDMGLGFDESPWGVWYIGWDTPEEAMREAEEELAKRIAEMVA